MAPGANSELRPDDASVAGADAVLCQQEIPAETVARAAELAPRFFLNAAPARGEAPDAELTVVNRLELEALGERGGLVCLTLGAEGAVLLEDGAEIARAAPPAVVAVDGTGAGTRSRPASLSRSSKAATAKRRSAARASPARWQLPSRARKAPCRPRGRWTRSREHEDRHRLRPRPRRRDGHPPRARVAGGPAHRRHDRRRQPDTRQDDAQRARHARDRAVAPNPGRSRCRRAARAHASHGRARPWREWPRRPGAAASRRAVALRRRLRPSDSSPESCSFRRGR